MSRLSELLKELLTQQRLTQADVVRRAGELGMPVSKGTVSTYFSNPPQRPRRQVLEALATVFDVPVTDLEDAAAFTGREPFTPDPSADRLTPPQRAVLNELIRVMADANTGAGEDDASTPLTHAAGSAATEENELAGDLAAFKQRQRAERQALVDGADLDEILGQAANTPGRESDLQRQDEAASKRGEENQD